MLLAKRENCKVVRGHQKTAVNRVDIKNEDELVVLQVLILPLSGHRRNTNERISDFCQTH